MKKAMKPRKLKLTRETLAALTELTQLENVLGGSHSASLVSKVKTNCASDLCPTREY